MTQRNASDLEAWFQNCRGSLARKDLDELRRGIAAGRLDEQDEYGMTALSLAVMSGWIEGVEALLRAGANTELRYFRTGETALKMAVQQKDERLVSLLVAGGANPDAPNHWGLTPRAAVSFTLGASTCFDGVPLRPAPLPPPHIQNAEHLADHYHPRFKIPRREERETMRVGQAVDLYVYGPKSDGKQDTVKVRISEVSGDRPGVRYKALLETPPAGTHLAEGTTIVEFGPEHIASVYLTRKPAAKKTEGSRKKEQDPSR